MVEDNEKKDVTIDVDHGEEDDAMIIDEWHRPPEEALWSIYGNNKNAIMFVARKEYQLASFAVDSRTQARSLQGLDAQLDWIRGHSTDRSGRLTEHAHRRRWNTTPVRSRRAI